MRTLFRLFFPLYLIASGLLLASTAPAQELPDTTRLLRFPTTNGTQIVFCYAGELYTVGKEGGIARRLTSGPVTARSRVSRRMARNSPSLRNMTVTPKSM